MKILHVIESTATGTLSMASVLANAQASSGHAVEVIYSRRNETPKNLESYFGEKIALTNMQMRSFPEKLAAVLGLRRKYREIRPDVVVLHSSFAGFIGRVAGLLHKFDARFFYIPHCISLMRKDVGRGRLLLFALFEKLAATKRSTFIACSDSEKKVIQKWMPSAQIAVVKNAVDLSSIARSDTGSYPEKFPVVITIGQIRKQKNPELFAAIARLVKKNLQIEFKWIGDGDPRYKKTLEESGVSVLGWRSRPQAIDYLRKSTIYLSTASWEGLPVSLIEACYAKVPIVCTKCAGNIDVVAHNKTGWLFEKEDEAASIILKAVLDAAERSRMAEGAFSFAQSEFSTVAYMKKMNELMCLNG